MGYEAGFPISLVPIPSFDIAEVLERNLLTAVRRCNLI